MSEFDFISTEEQAELAATRGCTVIAGDDHTLLIDLDDGASLNDRVLQIIHKRYHIESNAEYGSRNGKGKHVIIQLGVAVDMVTRLALQAMLGSDAVREVLSLVQHEMGHRTPSILFRPNTPGPTAGETGA